VSALHDHVMWRGFVAPGVVGLWNGGHMKSFAFRGNDITSASEQERVRLSEQINAAFSSLGARWTEHIEAQNNEVRRYQKSEWPTAASALLDAEREADCNSFGAQYEMRHYLTLTELPASSSAKLAVYAATSGDSQQDAQRRLDGFRRTCDSLAKLMRGIMHLEELNDDDTATYLHSTVSTRRHHVRAADHEVLSVSLGDEKFSRGFGLAQLGRHYAAVLTLGGFPKQMTPQMLDSLSKLPFRFRWVTRWSGMNDSTAQAMMASREEKALGATRYLKDMIVAKMMGQEAAQKQPQRTNRKQEALATQAGEAMVKLGDRSFGHMTTVFVVTDRDANRCLENKAKLENELARLRLVVRDEIIEQVKPWRMSLPGNTERGRRTYPVSSRNLADLMPASSLWQGRDFDARLSRETGVKRAWMYVSDPVTFRLNTEVPGGGAHALLLGKTGGGGKSTLANHLGYQYLGWPRSQVISLSVGRSEYGSVALNGGAIYTIGEHDSIAFQPLAYVDEPKEALAALEWLQLCLEAVGETVTPERSVALAEAIRLRASDAQKRRTMSELVGHLRTAAPDLERALRVYTRAGAYGHIFDGDDGAALERKRWTMFDVAALLEMRPVAVIPTVAHLLHRVGRWFDGRPTLLILDEFPDWIHHKPLEKFVVRVLDTKRKDNVRALMIAQTPDQLALYPRLLASVKSGCATKIFGPETDALTMAESYAMLNVTPRELERIASEVKLGSYLLKNTYGSRVFSYRPGPIAMALTNTDDRALLAEMRQRCSDTGELLAELLQLKGLTAEAGKLGWKKPQSSGQSESTAAE
jgi:type IV secretion system protein TrbE